MKRLTVLIIVLIFYLPGFCQTASSKSKIKSSQVNPFRNIKSSLFLQYGVTPVFGSGFTAGMEIRRFISLEKYIFIDVMYSQWQKEKRTNYIIRFSSYQINGDALAIKMGLGVFSNTNVYFCAHYLTNVTLKETLPPVANSDVPFIAQGNITPYTRQFVPTIGTNYRYKVWKIIFLEVGTEFWITQNKIFKPLEGRWKVPDKQSPLLLQNFSDPYYYLSVHFKI
jgi:hypothetical protein